MPVDKFRQYAKAATAIEMANRRGLLNDTVMAIGGAVGGKKAMKGLRQYLEENLTPYEE